MKNIFIGLCLSFVCLLTGCMTSSNIECTKTNMQGLPVTQENHNYKITYNQASTKSQKVKTYYGHGLNIKFLNENTIRFGVFVPGEKGDIFECIVIDNFTKEDSLVIYTEYEKMTTTTTVKKK